MLLCEAYRQVQCSSTSSNGGFKEGPTTTTTIIFQKVLFHLVAHQISAINGTSDEKSLCFLCVPCLEGDVMRHPGVSQNRETRLREMNSQMVVVVSGPSLKIPSVWVLCQLTLRFGMLRELFAWSSGASESRRQLGGSLVTGSTGEMQWLGARTCICRPWTFGASNWSKALFLRNFWDFWPPKKVLQTIAIPYAANHTSIKCRQSKPANRKGRDNCTPPLAIG